jgi:hypothetical protein
MFSLCSAQDLLHPVRSDQAVPAPEHGQEDLHIWPQCRPVEKCPAAGDRRRTLARSLRRKRIRSGWRSHVSVKGQSHLIRF